LSAKEKVNSSLEGTLTRASILNCALLLECGANILIAEIIEGSLRADVDKLSFISKYQLYARLSKNKKLDRGRIEVQNVESLRKARDRLVHPKPKNRAMVLLFDKENDESDYETLDVRGRLAKGTPSLNNEDAFAVLKLSLNILNIFC